MSCERLFLEADLTDAEPPVRGTGAPGTVLPATVRFSRPGQARVVFRWVMGRGRSGHDLRRITVW